MASSRGFFGALARVVRRLLAAVDGLSVPAAWPAAATLRALAALVLPAPRRALAVLPAGAATWRASYRAGSSPAIQAYLRNSGESLYHPGMIIDRMD